MQAWGARLVRWCWSFATMVLVLVVVLALGATGCRQTGGSSGARILKLGVMGPFTGPSSRLGEEFKGAVTMAFDEVGWRIGDYKVEIVWIDSQSDPEKAARAYEDAVVRDGIQAGLLNWHSSTGVACMEIVAKHKIPHFFGMAATDVIDQKYHSDPKYHYWMAKGWPTPSKLTVAYVSTLEDAISRGLWQPRSKTAVICAEDTDWGRSFARSLAGQLEEAGWRVLKTEFFKLGETDFYPLLTGIRALAPAVCASSVTSAQSFSALVKQAREIRLNSLMICDGLGWIGEWYQLTGDASDYVLDQIPQWTTARAQEFRSQFKQRWGFEPSPSTAGLAYDHTRHFIALAQETIQLYGKLDSETLFKAGQELLCQGKAPYSDGIIMKRYQYTPETVPDPVVGKDDFIFPVIQYKGGKGKIIWPEEWKEGDLEIPDFLR